MMNVEEDVVKKEVSQVSELISRIGKEIVNSRGKNPVHFYNLGIIYRSLDQYKEAIAALQRTVKISSSMKIAWFKLGQSYEIVKKFKDAIDAYRQLVELDSRDKHGWNDLGIGYQYNGQNYRAIEAFKNALDIDPWYDPALFNLGNIYKKLGKFQEAEKMYVKMRKSPSHFATLWYRIPERKFFNHKKDR